MELAKTNLFEKLQKETPIGLCALGLGKKPNLSKQKKSKGYPKFFGFDRVSPIAN